ncbi:DNA polymerase III subunit alpha [Candidatus Woesebacteria bacterium RIFOXYB1_FULL_42_36]|uniref:DNA polymerase III subunit alpha n=1 Tax=Candidatus Woesebacteria bacterium GW2011_GWB1_44_11 TaxID=1618579 RepID=A0A837I9L9_9BACT|nr:MAG: polymerase III, alpha subunit protein [Candidatus Woesebacteria bacterium GW2011_GWB1_44_11]OGM76374.1 MAG: DNA polymerase III subunit alpha [Candidatus Woesebacteria bacterium RIFOXYA1_FULL_43_16]OGM81890.1 MAG: DNA polymerase III subunit alpha [Candidatus Woesebacteria bacterium RIFOXYB1_FULL_42_36]
MSKFVHLHVHTEYSLLDGLSNIKRLLNHVKENGMDSIAVTDHGVMYGEIEFYKEAKKQEVKPILGMEGYITQGKLTDKPARGELRNYHLILLAKNNEGYQNLMKLSSIAHLNGYYYRPRFDRETLEKYSKGLICTSACPMGEVGQAIINDEPANAKKTIEWYLDVFGKDYYLEIQRHEFGNWIEKAEDPGIKTSLKEMDDQEKKWNQGIIKLSRGMGVPLVATNDAHYIKPADALAQDVLVCVATGKVITDTKRMRYIDAQTFYVRSPEEMSGLFSDVPDALENTVKIADKCDFEITLGKWFFPKFPIPGGVTPNEQLNALARESLIKKIPKPDKETKDRLEYELDIICTKGYAPYFLIIRDLANWTNSRGIITNTRGSAAGSLVSYVLGITTVNPLKYYLPFERFLNPFRPSPPDIDFDVADDRREEIISYITEKYGKDKVAQVCTFGRMLSRAAVRDVARVLGFPYSVGDRIAKMIPPPKQGFPITIPAALDEVLDLRTLYDTDADTKKVLDLAIQIEGNARHISVHAAGVVVAPSAITDFTPVQKEPSGEKIITQYEMHACEDVGLIKFDILGIRNLSILGAAVDIVKKRLGITVDLHTIPLDDKKTFEMLAKGETMGVFQLASGGMTKYLTELKPTQIEDLMVMVALYRPGPISQIPEYIRRKHNPKLIKYLDPRMEKFLGKSYGLIVYQDDLLFCALDLAGYTWEEADKFRKAVGKKIPEEMAAQMEKFKKGIVANGQTEEFAEQLWKLFEPFQSYGFNKAHAASYGMVAYQTAYMKANYSVEYMTALLTAESDDKEKVTAAINECVRMKIKVLPPDINESEVGFTIVPEKNSLNGKGIRFGLSAVKNVGEAAIGAILSVRGSKKFLSFADFLSRVDARKVNKKVLESLIKVGAMSAFGSRAALLASMESIREKVVKPKGDDSQQGLFATGDLKKTEAASVITLTNIQEFSDDYLESLERQLLGFSLSAKPIAEIIGPLQFQSTHKIFEITSSELYSEMVRVAGVITEVKVIITRKTGAEMAFAKFDDGTGTLELVIFPKVFKASRDFWVEGQPLLVIGKVDSRDETPAVLVESIETISSLSHAKKKEVFIKIPKSSDTNALKRLKTLLTQNLGDQTAFLVFEGGRRVKIPFTIVWNETLAKQISEIVENGGH